MNECKQVGALKVRLEPLLRLDAAVEIAGSFQVAPLLHLFPETMWGLALTLTCFPRAENFGPT